MTKPLEVVAGVIVDQRGVLVALRRAGTHLGGLWEFPGGKVRPGEGVADALRRELREELGVQAEVGRLLGVIRHAYPDAGSVRLHFHVCRIAAGQPRPLAASELRWVRPSGLKDLNWPSADVALVAWLANLDDPLRLWDRDLHFNPATR